MLFIYRPILKDEHVPFRFKSCILFTDCIRITLYLLLYRVQEMKYERRHQRKTEVFQASLMWHTKLDFHCKKKRRIQEGRE